MTLHVPENFLELRIWDYGEPFDIQTEIERAAKEAHKNKDLSDIGAEYISQYSHFHDKEQKINDILLVNSKISDRDCERR